MKNSPFIAIAVALMLSCNDSNKHSETTSVVDTTKNENVTPVSVSGDKRVNWEIGDAANVNKIMEFYKFWDAKNFTAANEYFADTVRIHIPTVRGELIVPNAEVSKKLAANREMYESTSNEILSSVALRDKVTGEEWVMITAYSKWVEKNGKRDSILYHDDWRLVNGKIDQLISFHSLLPKGFVPAKD